MFNIVVRYSEELVHLDNGITIAIYMDYLVFYSWPHIFSVNCRKSRSKLFSLFKRLISRACSATTLLGIEVFREQPLGLGIIPALIFSFFDDHA